VTMLTESDLHAMAMESETAYQHMQELCYVLGFNFPPKLEPRAPSTMADPIPQHEWTV
jgi:hypothetical protein